MSLKDERPQMSRQLEFTLEPRGEASRDLRSEEESKATKGNERSGASDLLRRVVTRDNMKAAWKRVKRNRGSAGVDGLTIQETMAVLVTKWPTIREQLLDGTYQPSPVKQVEIPKASGNKRKLGIPTVTDRLIQQAILQVLQPIFDPGFSEHSFGFRPNRSAHGAIASAQRAITSGKTWVVDVDLKSFFDLVDHDVLMTKVARRISDKQLLGLIGRYLRASTLVNGVEVARTQGTPQGGPLSPLLANILLDEVDKELERRGHAFARYADDCNVFVGSRRAGERVMNLMRQLYQRLRLVINEEKSAVAPFEERAFLGYAFNRSEHGEVQRSIAKKSLKAFKAKVRILTDRNQGRSLTEVIARLRSFILGWKSYYDWAQDKRGLSIFDALIRRRLRCLVVRQSKHSRGLKKALLRLGVAKRLVENYAFLTQGPSRTARFQMNALMPIRLFDQLGLPRLV